MTFKTIFKTWWPLAASWLLMASEMPLVSAVIARMPDFKVNLAAFGGIAFPVLFVFEAPVEMLLAASTALCKDWPSYKKIQKITLALGFFQVFLLILVTFTPLYYLVAHQIIGAPPETIEPARQALMLLIPFPFAVAYRRFQQGVLIRLGYSQSVGAGTILRLSISGGIIILGFLFVHLPSYLLAGGALTCGALCEMGYASWRVQQVLGQVKTAPLVQPALTTRGFLAFYIPLAATTIIMFFFEAICSAAISRMPNALDSLAVWPVVGGLIFLLQSFGVAYNEVVVALLDRPKAFIPLRNFAILLGGITTLLALLLAATPLATLWFEKVSALTPTLAEMARLSFWVWIPGPAISVLQSWFQGLILHTGKTRGITEAIFIALSGLLLVLIGGVVWGKVEGIYVGTMAYMVSSAGQMLWLYFKSRAAVQQFKAG